MTITIRRILYIICILTSCLATAHAIGRQYVTLYTQRVAEGEEVDPVRVKALVKADGVSGQKAVCAGEGVTLTLEVTGTDQYSAVWHKVEVADALQEDGNPLVLADLTTAASGRYYCEVVDRTDAEAAPLYSDTLTLTVHSYEVGIDALPGAEYCVGDTVVVYASHRVSSTNTDTLFRWVVAAGVGTVVDGVSADSVKIVLKAGGEVQLESSAFGCPAQVQRRELMVHPFQVRINREGLPAEVCRGDELVLAATGDATTAYAWTGAGVTGESDQAAVKVKFDANGKYILRAEDGVCRSADSVAFRIQRFTVKIDLLPEDLGICAGAPLHLSAVWEGDNSLGLPSWRWTGEGVKAPVTNHAVDIVVGENAKYVVEAALGVCKAKDSVTYTVHHLQAGIVPLEAGKLNICNGDTVELQSFFGKPVVAGDTLFTWSAEQIAGDADDYRVKAVLENAGTVQLKVRDRYCVDSTQVEFTIQQFGVKIQTGSPDRRICSGDSVTLVASGTIPAIYSWRGKGILSEGEESSVKVKFSDNGMFVLNSQDLDGKCKDTDTIRYTVEQFSGKIVRPAGEWSACVGDAIHLTAEVVASETGPVGYRWEGNEIPGVTDQGEVDIVATLNGKYKLYTSLSRCRDVDSITYTVHDFQAGIVPPLSAKVCYGDTVVLHATIAATTSDTLYKWTAAGIIGRDDLDSVKVVLKEDGRVSLTCQSAGCTATDEYLFDVVHYGVKIQRAGNDPEVCSGSEMALAASNVSTAVPGSVWQWSGAGILPGEGGTAKVKFEGNGKFYLLYSDGYCHEKDSIEFIVRKYEVNIELPSGDLNRCWLDTLTLLASNRDSKPEGGSYSWKGAGVSGDLTAGAVKVKLGDNDRFVLRASDGKCYSDDTVNFQIHKYEVSIRQPEQWPDICRGTEVTLGATNAGATLPEGATYEWQGEGLTGDATAAQAKFVVGEKAEYALKAYDGTCFIYDTLRYKVQEYVTGIQPPTALEVCYGDVVTLRATDATGDTYSWSGEGISGAADQSSAEVRLTENGVFQLHTTKGVCTVDDEVRFTVKRYSLSIPGSQVLPGPQKLTLRAAKEPNSMLDWYIGATHVSGPSADETAELDIRSDAQVKVVMTMNVDKCTSTAYCNVRVGARDSRKYQGGRADGFAMTRPSLKLRRKDTTACVNTTVIARLQTVLFDSYNYEWFQVGNESQPPVCTAPDLYIARCQLADEGKYYCRVKDAEGDGYIYSDTLELTIADGPVAEIELPEQGTDLCYGEELILKAGSVAAHYSYMWTGADVQGGVLTEQLALRAAQGGLYTLTVSDGSCQSTDSIRLKVNAPIEVDIPEQINLTIKQSVEVSAWTNTAEGEVTWNWQGTAYTGRGPVTLDIQQPGKLYAVLKDGRCETGDSCRVYIKEATTFAGGDNDGFDESVAALKVVKRELVACTGESAVMDVSGVTASNCKYEWYRVGVTDEKVSSERTYTLMAVNLLQAGDYYCQATSGDRQWNSDTLTLTVNQGPVALIQGDPRAKACYGERKEFTANTVTGRYEWSGMDIIGGRTEPTVVLKAKQGGTYILKVSEGSCSTTDTVELQVVRPEVDIPDLMYLAERGPIRVGARRSDPETVVDWYVGGSSVLKSKDSVTLEMNGSGRIRVWANIVEEGCPASDTLTVFVKEAATFTTGKSLDDGFALSVPQLRVEKKALRPCPTEDVVMKLRGDNTGYYQYVWYKVALPADEEVGKGMSYEILKSTNLHNGEYYCKALRADEAGEFYSDTVTLEVSAGVIASLEVKDDNRNLCYGNDLIFMAQPSGSRYTYKWSGPGVAAEGGVGDRLEMKATASGQYALTVSDGKCESTDTMTIQVTRLMVDLAASQILGEPGTVAFTAFTPEDQVLWYVNNTLKNTGSRVQELDIRGNCRVRAQVEAAGCVDSAVCEVFVKNGPKVYVSGLDDGFAESKPALQVKESRIVVCPGHEAVIAVRESGYGNYRYEWYKDDGTVPVYEGREYVIRESKVADGGLYYCLVKKPDSDEGEEEYWKSPMVSLTVTAGPLAAVEPLASAVCYGAETELDALTGTGTSQSGQAFDYAWSGPGADGLTGGKITIRPWQDALYIVTVSDAATACSDTASVFVKVNQVVIELPAHLSLAQPQTYRFEAYNPAGAVLEWFIDDVPQSGDRLSLQQNCVVKVKATLGDCAEYASCTVYVRQEDIYATTLEHGDDDGFAVTLNRPVVKVVPKELEVCTANAFTIGLQITGDGLYHYKWYRTDKEGVVMSEGKAYSISNVNANVKGKYYCIVENLMVEPSDPHRFLFSDTTEVTYREGPKAVIGSPLEGADVCNGVPVVLDASASQGDDPAAGYTYEWFGWGADGLTEQQITIVPKGEMYVVKVGDGYCSSTDTVRLHMNSPEILLPEQLHLSEGKTVELQPEKAAGTRINWYVDENLRLPNSDIGRLAVDRNCMIVAEVVKNVTDGTCSGYDTTWVYVKSPATFTSGDGLDDGFAQFLPKVQLRQLAGQRDFCRGTPLFSTLAETLPEKLLKYEWRKVGSLRVVSEGRDLWIPECQPLDSGRYYCMATDLAATEGQQKTYFSDTVKLNVLNGPVAKISSPAEGQLICYQAALDLDASETEIGKYPYTDVYEYLWTGEKIKAPTLYHTQANPEVNGRYILQVTNGTCTTYDTVSVVIKAPDVHIRRSLFIAKDGNQRFVVDNPEQNNVTWYVDNTLKLKGKDTADIYLVGDCHVIVEMEAAGCRKVDTCLVFKKEQGSFAAGIGEQANDDGFYVSGTSFYINKVVSTELVCNGATSVFTIDVVGNDFYRYAWKKQGNPTVLSNDKIFRIEKTKPTDAGAYYCEVTDVSNNNTRVSAEVSLEVIEMPETKIVAEKTAVCEGTPLTMQADRTLLASGRDYTYLWTGTGVSANRESSVTVKPANSGRYILTISDANCFTKDTIDITVKKQNLKVQKVFMVKAGDNISIPAEVEGGTKVSWRVNNVMYNNVNPLVLNGLKESVTYTAESSGVCAEKVTGNVFVRSNAGYAGGEEDGFTMPNGMPQIIDHSPEIVGCGQDTASLFVEVLKKDEIPEDGYIWQKYDENKRDFAEWTPGLPEGHVTGLGTERIHFKVITAEDEGRYRCRIRSAMGFTNGPATYLVKGTVPRIDGPLNDIQKCEGKDIHFLLAASVKNGKDPQYRWYYSETPDNFRQLLPEMDLDRPYYDLESVVKDNEGYYMTEVYNLCGSVYDTAFLEIWQKPVIVRQSGDTAVCLETPVRLWVEARGGGNYGYSLHQVEKDQNGHFVRDIRRVYLGTEPWYDLLVPSDIDEGDYVWTVWNECDSTRHTRSFHLEVEHSPEVSYSYLDTTICIGTRSIQLDARTNITGPGASTHYRWTKDGAVFAQQQALHTIDPLNHADTGVYKCYAYNACPDVLMKEFRVHKKEAPLIAADIALAKLSYCEGEPIGIEVHYGSDAGEVTQQWYFNSQPVKAGDDRISGTMSDSLRIDSVIQTDQGRYYVILHNQCGNRQSNSVTLTVDLPARFAEGGRLEGKNQYLCLGDNTAIAVTATGKAEIDYTWTKDGTTLAGAKSSRLQLNSVGLGSAGEYCCYIQNECNKQAEYTCDSLFIITPEVYVLAGGGKYCGYEEGREVTLSGFEPHVTYQLYRIAQDGSASVVATVNGAEVAAEGTLSFGMIPAGRYYAMAAAVHGSKVCNIRMDQEIEIIRDITPAQYEFVVSDPICTGGTNGSLTLQGSENDPTIEYTLQRYADADTWNNYGRALPGTGSRLTWNNLAAGVYRVQAVSTLSGCTLQIGEADTLAERAYPEIFSLQAQGGDTTNCQNMEPDVVLVLNGGEADCRYTLMKDGVSTDRTLSGNTLSWDKVAGTEGGSIYTVSAETKYGCVREMGEVTVVEKKAPVALLVKGGGYFCSGDTEGQLITIEGVTQFGVRYDIYKRPEIQVMTDTVFYGVGKPIVFEMPDESAAYYVRGLDTLDGCVGEMQNDFSIQEDSLKIQPIPTQTIDVGTSTLLYADIRNAVGSPVIVWEPAALFPSGGNTVQGPQTVRLEQGERFIVTVNDEHCSAEAEAEVRLKGAHLYTQIKLQNCLTDADTLRLCEGETVNLCSWTDGGEAPYTFRWLDKNVSSPEIGHEVQLSGYAKEANGYIYLEVKTGVGQLAQDSIWVEFEPKPRQNLVIENQGLNCALVGESVDFVVQDAETEVVYTLEYAADSRHYQSTGQVQTGEGNNLTFSLVYGEETAGYYRLQAGKRYTGGNVCSSVLTLGEVWQRPERYTAALSGNSEYCADTQRDSIRLQATEAGVTYRLVNTSSQKMIAAVEGQGDPIVYAGYYGSGRYRVVGQLGVCRDTMDGVIQIHAVERPLIGEVTGLGVYCLNDGDRMKPLVVANGIRGVEYTLYRDSVDKREKIGDSKYSPQGSAVSFGVQEKAGSYFIVSGWQEGMHCTDTVRGLSLINPPKTVKLKENSGMYCYADGGLETIVKIYDIDPLVEYQLKDVEGNVVGTFGERNTDTLYCPVTLKGGTYYVWSTATQCSDILGVYTVNEHKQLADLKLLRPLTECDGYALTMGVEASEKGITYELYEVVGSGLSNRLDAKVGDGKDLVISTRHATGSYVIRAVDPAGCELELSEVYTISPLPDHFNMTASALEYCAGDAGVILGLDGTQAGVNYWLQRWDANSGEYVNVSASAVIYGTGATDAEGRPVEQVFSGKFKAGRYQVVTAGCHQQVMDGGLEIAEIPQPEDITVSMRGVACVDSVITIVIGNTEPDVRYALLHNGVWTGLDTLPGTGRDSSWTFTKAEAGVYHVQAIRKGCAYALTGEVTIGVPTKLAELAGADPLCANETATLSLNGAELSSVYQLWGKTQDTLFEGVVSGNNVIFEGVTPGDEYVVIARNEMCETRSGALRFEAKELPVAGDGNFVIEDCSGSGKGDILLHALNNSYLYTLVGPDCQVKLMNTNRDSLLRDMAAGEYCLTVQNLTTKCALDPICRNVRRALPLDSVVLPLDYCEGENGVVIRLSGSTYNVRYSMLQLDETPIETINYPVKAFVNPYTAGKYLLRKENLGLNGGCVSLEPVEVKKVAIPQVDFEVIAGTEGSLCETGNNLLTLAATEPGVDYILRLEGRTEVDTLRGDGGALTFEGRKKAGNYEIIARSAGKCQAVFPQTWKVNPIPAAINAQDGNYCYDAGGSDQVRGASIFVKNLDPSAKYYLCNEEKVDSVTALNSAAFQLAPEGEYVVTGIYPKTGCQDTVARVAIREVALPDVFAISNTLGDVCDIQAQIHLSGSESEGVEYSLYMNDNFLAVGPFAGTGGPLDFGMVDASGSYRIYAKKTGTECGVWMDGRVVIATPPPTPLLEVRGVYCQGETTSNAKIVLLNPVKGWTYFLTLGGEATEQIKAGQDQVVAWDSIYGRGLVDGTYMLNGINECGDLKELATATVKAMPSASAYKILCEKTIICTGERQELRLENSEVGVSYKLKFRKGDMVTDLLSIPLKGTGGSMNLGEYSEQGAYFVEAIVDSTQCTRTMDTLSLTTSDNPPNPVISGPADTTIMPGGTVIIRLGDRRQPRVDYYLLLNGVPVDTLSRFADPDIMNFEPQQGFGDYDVIASSEVGCQSFTYGPGVSEKPDLTIDITGAGDTTICSGFAVDIRLDSSQLGCKYMLVKNGWPTRDTLRGTGEALFIKRVMEAGNYQIMVMAGKEDPEYLYDHKHVVVLESPALGVSEELGYCAGGAGVEIQVKNTDSAFTYYISSDEGYIDFWKGDGGDKWFTNYGNTSLFKKGEYDVKVVNPLVRDCPTIRTVNIREVDLPAPYAFTMLGGGKYMCEYPEARTLVLASSQPEVEYSLYRRSKPGELAAPVVEGTGKELTFQVQDTGVYYVAARSMIGEGCESEMANDVEIIVPEAIQVFDLSSIRSSYCDTAKVVFGSVKLSGSESDVSYELYRDGKATGMVMAGNRSILKWAGLKGKPAALATGGDNDGYVYTVNGVNQETGCSRRMTGQVSMIEESSVLISRQDPDLDVCMGSEQTLHIYASGGMLNYQWKKDGRLISTERYYSLDSITQEDIGTYQCYVSNQCGYDVSADINVNVRAVVILEKKMKDMLICEDPADVRIPCTAVAEEYKWYRRGSDEVISDKQILELTGATGESDAGYYVCYASTSCGGIFDTCRLEFNRKPEVIRNGDVEKTLCVGSDYRMELESRDTVRWYRNGNDLGVTGNVYDIAGLETGHAGLYTVVASNKCSSSVPIPVQTLYADEPIEVVSVTDSLKHYCQNTMVTLEIVTQPAERVTYKWYRNNNFYKDNVGNKLQFTGVQAENGVNYLVRFSNACTDLSAPLPQRGMTIRIDGAVKYEPLGAETQVCAHDGDITNLVLKAADVEGETYRWYYSPDGLVAYQALEVDTAILPLENKRPLAGYYYSTITNACETATTDITQVMIDSLPVISGDLRDTTICEHSDLIFRLKALGGHLTYRWMKQKKNSDVVETPNIYKPAGFETESQLELKTIGVADDSCRIWCEISNHCDTVYSDTAVIRVIANAVVKFEEPEVVMCEGADARVVVRLEHGHLPATYGYTLNGGATILRDMMTESTDTLVIAEAGTYQLVSLVQNSGGCVDQHPASALEASYYERFTATLAGNFDGCVGTDAEFTITVDKGEGPWAVEIVRESDGKVADEMGEFPMTLNDKVSTLTFKPVKNEHYRISRIVQQGGSGCTGLTKGVAATQVHQPNRVAFNALTTDIFGGCANVDFNTLLRPTVSGGVYSVNSKVAESTGLPLEPGKYHIVYVTRTAYGCEDSARVDLTRDTLPRVTLTCDDELCPGESTDLQIHVDGTGPCTVTTNMKEINLDNRETFFNNLRKRTDANGNCSYNIFNNNDLKSRTYEVVSVTDKYGCGLDPAVPLARKVITMRERPLIQVETQHALYNNGGWTTDIKEFVIPDKGTVNFRVTRLRGGTPWDVSMERTLNGEKEVFHFPANVNPVLSGIQATEGVYRFSATDHYCSMAEELTEERKVTYTETGYLKVKVVLEGAYSEDAGTMVSQIEEVLPLNGLDRLPDAGAGRQWIDWVVLELRKTIVSEATIRDTLLLRSDGFVADRTGNELLTVFGENFSLLQQNAYYVVIKHRNHLPIASTKYRIFTEPGLASTLDLTEARNIYTQDGDLVRHMKELNLNGAKHIWGMAVGNILENELISVANPSAIQRKGYTTTGKIYDLHDVNFDGVVRWDFEGILNLDKHTANELDDAFRVYKNRNLFSEVPEAIK